MTLFLLFLLAQAVQGPSVPPAVVNAEKAWAGGDVLWPLAESRDPATRQYALRALGRLEDPANVPRLIALGRQPGVPPGESAMAVARSLNGFDPAKDPQLMETVSSWVTAVVFVDVPNSPIVNPEPAGAIQYGNAAQVQAAETAIVRLLEWAADDQSRSGPYLRAVRSLESLARLNARLTPFVPDTVTRLSRIVSKTRVNDGESAREAALAALIASRRLTGPTAQIALLDPYEQVRRLATAVLAGAGTGAGLDDTQRLDLIQRQLRDPNGQVRYEAVRGFVRRGAPTLGCDPLLALVADGDSTVALAAIDALGDLCKDNEGVTTRLIAEARTPSGPAWHRPAHAFVALAKRAPARAAMSMEAFATHPSWWVRMYAARAASAADDAVRLDKLAYDSNDNVREAALVPLRRLKKGEADTAIVAALDRSDVQLLRTAATLLKESPANARIANALSAALLRLTKEGKETSRDARVPLLEALAVHAGPEHAQGLLPLLKDFDPVVAAKAAPLVSKLTGNAAAAEPIRVVRGWPQQFPNLNQCVSVSLSSGKSFTLRMDPEAAPVTVDRFLKLALVDRYYDGLTFHRVAPNFVLQGGGPGANEYSGHKEYMRDEVGARNSRGTVGLSTRGRNTADAQIYVNLIDNPRLDSGYTVFAHVSSGMAVIDAIEEGEVMSRLSPVACTVR